MLKEIDKKIKNTGAFPFCAVNKSYAKDVYWSVALYSSWITFSKKDAPFFVVIPRRDLTLFQEEFLKNFPDNLPIFLSEEDFLDHIDVKIPIEFNGWHTQQIIKLGFAKTGWADRYIALDSAMIFQKPFDWEKDWGEQSKLFLVCGLDIKERYYSYLDTIDEKTWLRSALVPARISYEEIDRIIQHDGSQGGWYPAPSIFDSAIVQQLESFLRDREIDGIVGAIQIAPYEFRWYGTYLLKYFSESISLINADYFKPIISKESADEFLLGQQHLTDRQIGFLFQPPASDFINPKEVFNQN